MHEYVTLQVKGWPGSWTYLNHVPDIAVGDVVVIEAPGADLDLRFAKVIDVAPKRQQRRKARKWIVDRIDLDKYNALSQLVPPESIESES